MQNIIEGLRVQVVNGQFDKALRIFSKKVQTNGKLKEVRDRMHYEKPCAKRKMAKLSAKRREANRIKDDIGAVKRPH